MIEKARQVMAQVNAERTGKAVAQTKPGITIAELKAATDDPVVPVETWYPEFYRLHLQVIAQVPDFDYGLLRQNSPELYRQIKAKEDEIDALGAARLSEVMAVMREWRQLVGGAMFEQRQREAGK